MALFLIIVFLFPLAVYLSILAAVNRRPRPLMVSGAWDFAGLLFGVSGLLLITGPVIASIFYREGLASYLLRGSPQAMPQILVQVLESRIAYWGGYFGIIAAACIALLWWRNRSTVIYNVEPAALETALFGVLQQHGLAYERRGRRLYLRKVAPGQTLPQAGRDKITGLNPWDRAATGTAMAEQQTRIVPAGGGSMAGMGAAPSWVALDSFALLHNATLHWHGHGARSLREQIEPDLEKSLAAVETPENSVSGWLMGISGLLFLIMIFSTALVILFSLLPKPQ